MTSAYSRIQEAVTAVKQRQPQIPSVGLILGSGLGSYAGTLKNRIEIPFAEIPNFPHSTVAGHEGKLVLGEAEGVPVAALQGRVHFYEGYSMEQVIFPVRVLGGLGIRRLIVTNAAGGVNTGFNVGDLMLITDHINLTGTHPLLGPNIDDLGVRFPDMSDAYCAAMRAEALKVAAEMGIALRQGVYIGLSGPSYETPAEIRMCRILGGDAVGMSTVPEVIAASHMGMQVLGISCITNMAAGILAAKLTHQEVMDTTARVRETFISLVSGIIPRVHALANPGR
jgi:purine-nucleoside phosphorylase